MAAGRYLMRRGARYYYYRRVPQDVIEAVGRRFLKVPLNTDSAAAAKTLAASMGAATDAYWAELRSGGNASQLQDRYDQAVSLARRLGWTYHPLPELVKGPVNAVVERLEVLDDKSDAATVTALLGTAEAPKMTLGTMVGEYEALVPEEKLGKSPDQIRRWRSPRERAVTNLMALIGDKAMNEVSRADALLFRDWWTQRLQKKGLALSSANKDFTHLKGMYRILIDKLRLNFANPFAGLTFREGARPGKYRGASVSTDWIRKVVFSDALSGLNTEAIALVRILAETGARPGEVCGLRGDDIVLDDVVPHIKIRPNDVRAIKTDSSARTLPLVGGALEAARVLVAEGGVRRYLGKAVLFSSIVNSYLKKNKLFTNQRESLYSLRHAFQDRLIAVEVPERLQAELMGHALNRPRYGSGPSLSHKRDWMSRSAVSVDIEQ